MTKDVIEAWIKDIRAGQNTMDHPGPIAYNLARLAKERLLLKGHEYVNPRSRFQQQQHAPFNLIQVLDPRNGASFLPNTLASPTLPPPIGPRSPLFELESSPTAPVDLLDELFDFCERQIH